MDLGFVLWSKKNNMVINLRNTYNSQERLRQKPIWKWHCFVNNSRGSIWYITTFVRDWWSVKYKKTFLNWHVTVSQDDYDLIGQEFWKMYHWSMGVEEFSIANQSWSQECAVARTRLHTRLDLSRRAKIVRVTFC